MMTPSTKRETIPEPNTVIHKRIQGITEAILSLADAKLALSVGEEAGNNTNSANMTTAGLADIANAINNLQLSVKVPAPNISINISVYILLINLNIFIWWWLCRNKRDRMGCLMNNMRQSKLWDQAMKGYSGKNELEKRFTSIFETPVESIGLSSESLGEPTLQEKEEGEQKWMDFASTIQDLCMELLGSFAVESPEARQQAAPPAPPRLELFPTSLEEQLTEENLAPALPLLHELSQVEASLTQEDLDVANLDRLERQLEVLQNKLAEHPDLFNEDLARSASEPLGNSKLALRYQRLIQLQQLRQLILQYFASNS